MGRRRSGRGMCTGPIECEVGGRSLVVVLEHPRFRWVFGKRRSMSTIKVEGSIPYTFLGVGLPE